MTNREQLIAELQEIPDEVITQLLEYLHRLRSPQQNSPFMKFAGILNDVEAEEITQSIKADCRQVDLDEW